MVEAWIASVGPPLLATLLVSVVAESLLEPAPRLRARAPGAWAMHFGVCVIFFAIELALFRRPWFAATLTLANLLVLILISNAKFYSLREPFIYPDFEYLTDALRHPRLYLPFLGPGRAAAGLGAFLVSVYFGMTLEGSLIALLPAHVFALGLVALFACGTAMVGIGASCNLPLSLRPADDLRRLGLITSLWRYMVAERTLPDLAGRPSAFSVQAPRSGATLPDLIVVQSESFFDVRRWFPSIDPGILAEFDAVRASAVAHGRLRVDAWGANTVRTEFAFLSGLDSEVLGVHQFNPYRKVALAGIPTIAGALRQLGYRTVCIHPYSAGFYGRDRIFPVLGIDEFIDIDSFAGALRQGPFVADMAVADKVRATLDGATQPMFVFAITMENHGPLHLENVPSQEAAQLFDTIPAPGYGELAPYVRHLANASRMAGSLRDHLHASTRPGWLCFYGDHVPIMPVAYRTLGAPDGDTDYLVWGNQRQGEHVPAIDIAICELGSLLLRQAGLSADDSIAQRRIIAGRTS